MKKILLPFLLAASLSSFSQKVSGKLSFQKGQKLEVTTNTNSSTEIMMGEMSGNITNTEVYEVKDASPTAATLEKSVKAMKVNFSAMGQEKSFDSQKPEDLKGDIGAPMKKVLDSKFEFTVDGTGKITAVKADGTKKNTEDKSVDMMGQLMAQMNAGAAEPKVGNNSLFKVLPENEVGKGDTWTTTNSVNGNEIKSTYTVKDITANEVMVDFTEDGAINSKQEMMGMSMDIKGTTKSTGQITVDKATGLLKQKTTTATTETSTSVSGQEINSTSKATTVVTVKSI